MTSLLIKNGTVFTSRGRETADFAIVDGKVRTEDREQGGANTIVDAKDMFLFPGFIDCHVHFREPGYEHKATMQSESISARAGGVTTVCEMPNTYPPTTSILALQNKVQRASTIPDCDIRFFFGATEHQHLEQLQELWTNPKHAITKTRCCGLKLYFDHSTGNQKADTTVIEEAFKLCKKLDIQIVAHCEDPEINAAARTKVQGENIALHSLHRPVASEVQAIKNAITLVQKYGTRFHIAHLSTGAGCDLIRQAKKEGLPVTCEVTPHHLFLNVGHYEQLGSLVKMNPPLRTRHEQEALWEGIADGTIDCIATDHAPHTLEEKQSEPALQAPCGVPGVETMIPLLLTAAASDTITYEKIFELCFTNPNRIFGLQKEEILDGASPDIVLVEPNKKWVIQRDQLHAQCGWTPFEGTEVVGGVVQVLR
jgi:dihydroorotase